MNLEKINELTAQDMAGVNAAILEQLNSDVQLINQLGYYIVSGGGKRIRPMIAVLAARAVGYEGNAHVTIAALIEFIHTATLLLTTLWMNQICAGVKLPPTPHLAMPPACW